MDPTAGAVFDRNQKEFPTYVHRAIWDRSIHLMSPQISLADMAGERRDAFLDLYRFMQAVYADMYHDPDGYRLDAYGMEGLLGRQTWRQAMVSAKWNGQREKLRKLCEMEIVHLPRMFISAVSEHMTLVGGAAVLDPEVFDKRVVRKIRAKCYPRLPPDTVLEVLNRNGVQVTSADGGTAISNPRYPGMFLALGEWKRLRADHPRGNDKYKYDSAYNHLDYRAFLPAYEITYESVLSSMSDEVREYLSELSSLLQSLGLRFQKADRVRSLACDYRGEHLLYFGIDNTYPIVRTCMFKPGTPLAVRFARALEELPNADEVRAFCLKGLNRCRACGCHPVPPSQLGYWAEVLGRRVKLCGGRHCFETRDLSRTSCEIMKTLVRINCRLIGGEPV